MIKKAITGHVVPEQIHVATIEANAKRCGPNKITVTRWEMRAYRSSPYIRGRKNGRNPLVLKATLSGTGCPKWMASRCGIYSLAEFGAGWPDVKFSELYFLS